MIKCLLWLTITADSSRLNLPNLLHSEKFVSMWCKMVVTHGLPLSLRSINGPQVISGHSRSIVGMVSKETVAASVWN